ncbi:MAG: 2OG-Fe(II) oxygenase [Alphaproteobacteria bacterium]|nr:2OG-Fe(II) oxygenase [Alphaproteobacteria bacterium]
MLLNLAALQQAPLNPQPFPYLVLPEFVPSAVVAQLEDQFPPIRKPGSFPVSTLTCPPLFQQLIDHLRGAEFAQVVGEKLGMDLSNLPTTVTVRGHCRARDGKIHTDQPSKLVTVLLYLNGAWENPGGQLRLLNSPINLDDVIEEVPPQHGTLLLFKNQPNAWHGHHSFKGRRRVIQLNWVSGDQAVRKSELRHRISAFFKRLPF